MDQCALLCLDLPTAERVRAALPDANALTRAAAAAKACADPTRLTLLHALAGAPELCVCDLTWIAGKPQNLVSHHLRRLREAGMVETRRDAKIVFYSLASRGRAMTAALTNAGTLA